MRKDFCRGLEVEDERLLGGLVVVELLTLLGLEVVAGVGWLGCASFVVWLPLVGGICSRSRILRRTTTSESKARTTIAEIIRDCRIGRIK